MKPIKSLGKFMMFLNRLFTNREPFKVYVKLFFEECMIIGIDTLPLVAVTGLFMGAVTAVQSAYNLYSPLIPKYLIGTMVRDMTLTELAPTIIGIIFAGKVGSNIAGQLGTMRITEQIDALEVMGINSASYLILPKIFACTAMYPLLVILGASLSLFGGYGAGLLSSLYTSEEYTYGLRYAFDSFIPTFAIIKAFVFAFLVATISAYKGYFTEGGAYEVGIASTQAVTNSCIAILCSDYLLANLLMSR